MFQLLDQREGHEREREMDAFDPRARRMIGQPIGADQPPPPQHHQSPFWYPSSSPPAPAPAYNPQQFPFQHQPPHHHWPPHPPDGRRHDEPYGQHVAPPAPPGAFHGNPHAPLPPFPAAPAHPHAYPASPRIPYAGHYSPHHHPPLPPPHQPTAYPPTHNQVWGGSSWNQHQGWEHTGNVPHSNEEYWAARAKAWADAKSPTDGHHSQSHYMASNRMEDSRYAYHNHYQQAGGLPPPDSQHPLPSDSIMQQLPSRVAGISGSFNVGGEATATNMDHMASASRNSIPTPFSYEKEVSSSYSMIKDHNEALERSGIPLKSFSAPISAPPIQGVHAQSTSPFGRFYTEQQNFNSVGEPSKYFRDGHEKPSYGEPGTSVLDARHRVDSGNLAASGMMDNEPVSAPEHSWTPAGPGAFAPASPIASSAQITPSFVLQPSLSGHTASAFGGPSAPSFHATIRPTGLPVDLGAGTSLHSANFFTGDSSGVFSSLERPKKAAVPNWLREEIIKTKSVISNPGPTEPTDSSGTFFRSTISEDGDGSFRKSDQEDSKFVYSARSTEEDESNEDDLESERTAAINQEIKLVLTEVLRKVTDKIFDEIATEVLSENDIVAEDDGHHIVSIGHHAPIKPEAQAPPKAIAKVLVPVKMDKDSALGANQSSSSSSHGGNVLGLANYASDDDDGDEEFQVSNILSKGARTEVDKSNDIETVEEHYAADSSTEVPVENVDNPSSSFQNQAKKVGEADSLGMKVPSYGNLKIPEKGQKATNHDDRSFEDGGHTSFGNEINLSKKNVLDSEEATRQISAKANDVVGFSHGKNRESRAAFGKEINNVAEKSSKSRPSPVGDLVMKDIKSSRLEKRENGKDDVEKSVKHGSYFKDQGSQERHDNKKDERKENTKDKRELKKEDDQSRRERLKGDIADQSLAKKDLGRNTSRRSLSPNSRARSHSGIPFQNHEAISVDEPSKNSQKRNLLSHKHSRSPSPVRSRTRRVSRSPHSWQSHRWQSTYDDQRRKKSRSRSITPDQKRSSRKHKA